jgi:hypothetical protein
LPFDANTSAPTIDRQAPSSEMESAGYRLVAGHDFIESQHFQVFARTAP